MEGKEVAHGVGGRANLVVFRQGAEGELVGKERWEEIRRLHAAGQGVSAIGRLLELDRKTVLYIRCISRGE